MNQSPSELLQGLDEANDGPENGNPEVESLAPVVTNDDVFGADDEQIDESIEMEPDSEFQDVLERRKQEELAASKRTERESVPKKTQGQGTPPKKEEKAAEPVESVAPDGFEEFRLPKFNWLKVNQEYFDGSTPFHSFKRNHDGSMPPAVAKYKAQFDNMVDLGYRLVTSSMSSKGHYVFLFFELPEGAPDTRIIPSALLKSK